MPNKNYQKGVRLERKIVNKAKERGQIAFRSAGSHSPVDVCVIDAERKVIKLIQCKTGLKAKSHQVKLEQDNKLDGLYNVYFSVVIG